MLTERFGLLRRKVTGATTSGKQRSISLQYRNRRLTLENLEPKLLLAGDVMAELAGGHLSITGDNASNSIYIDTVERVKEDTRLATDGVTSVFLDFDLLSEAAGLDFSGVEGTVDPVSNDYLVGFEITEQSTFEFTINGGFEPIGGRIEHTGSVFFNDNSIEVGDFSIGFDADRAVGAASGFFVADTASGFGILFDVGAPRDVEFDEDVLTIDDADLLVSPEFAQFLVDNGLATGNLTGADVGEARIDAESEIFSQHRQVDGGKTSVYLDTALLADAANLTVTSLNGTADPAPRDPADPDFQVAFAIDQDSDFQFIIDDAFTPVAGQIGHTGTVGFNEGPEDPGIVVGDFSIGFDAARAGGDRSGFFVEDTVAGLGILFDVAAPGFLDFSDPNLTIDDADLLVSPEFAGVLLDAELAAVDLTGADVGDARIDATTAQVIQEFIRVRGNFFFGRTTINGARTAEFLADDVTSMEINTRGGNDLVRVRDLALEDEFLLDLGSGWFNRANLRNVDVDGQTTIEGGNGRDTVRLESSTLNDLVIDTNGGRDYVLLGRTDVGGDADIDLGTGWDRLFLYRASVEGDADFDGGGGFFDRFYSIFSDYGSLETDNFRFVKIFGR